MRTFAAIVVATLLAFLTAATAQASGAPPPPGWGQPAPLPPANGVGKATFKHGGPVLTLPLQKIEVTDLGGTTVVGVRYIDPSQQNSLSLHFGVRALAPGPVLEALITGVTARTKAGGVSKGNSGQTRCRLVLTKLSKTEVAGTANCEPMFQMNGKDAAAPIQDLRFEAKAK